LFTILPAFLVVVCWTSGHCSPWRVCVSLTAAVFSGGLWRFPYLKTRAPPPGVHCGEEEKGGERRKKRDATCSWLHACHDVYQAFHRPACRGLFLPGWDGAGLYRCWFVVPRLPAYPFLPVYTNCCVLLHPSFCLYGGARTPFPANIRAFLLLYYTCNCTLAPLLRSLVGYRTALLWFFVHVCCLRVLPCLVPYLLRYIFAGYLFNSSGFRGCYSPRTRLFWFLVLLLYLLLLTSRLVCNGGWYGRTAGHGDGHLSLRCLPSHQFSSTGIVCILRLPAACLIPAALAWLPVRCLSLTGGCGTEMRYTVSVSVANVVRCVVAVVPQLLLLSCSIAAICCAFAHISA